MSYDSAFDAQRLSQLAEQYLIDHPVRGSVLFQSSSDDSRLDHARWQFNDTDYKQLTDSGFKQHLMELLDTLLVYRAEHNQPNSTRGIISIQDSTITLEWLSESQFEQLDAE